ncbi:CYTH and CHAD domain-containing protein [Sphingomonas morindae]|uniref:CHAD domain-containing protein n=1 Tax=Sphingomonas morindae TaxID=1541170 RepID=A0ABY4XB96_9SPHN|nr:CYTH and CHAD domain-containing protein [Sphingomonas morindae]USI74118.1 CHAD domain-containing protein [Sphingomonas morindae]
MSSPTEIELKLEAETLAPLADLALLAALPAERALLVSTYYDTPEGLLRARGYTLRIREQEGRLIQTVKAEGAAVAGLYVRPEWECPLKAPVPRLDAEAGPLRPLLDDAAQGALAPRFVSRVSRRSGLVTHQGATIEVALDEGESVAGPRRAPLCEVELELKAGAPDALFDLARRLNAAVPVRLGVRTKAERGYALGDPLPASHKAEPVRIGGDAREAFAAVAAACIRHFRLNETLLMAGGGAPALHQARVALRRLRSAFSLFKPLFADDATALRLKEDLKAMAAALGTVRNLDVLIARLGPTPPPALTTARQAALEAALRQLASPEARATLLDLAQWLALGAWRTAPANPERAGQDAARFAAAVLERRRKRLKKQGAHLAALDDEARHQVRIEGKKLRYAAEFFGGLFGGKKARRRLKAFLAAIEALQEELGELNDLATAPTVYADLGLPLPAEAPDRAAILARAEAAYDDLIDVKRFWRT